MKKERRRAANERTGENRNGKAMIKPSGTPRVLLIEDDAYMAKKIKERLQKESYSIVFASNARFEKQRPKGDFDLIVASPAKRTKDVFGYFNSIKKLYPSKPLIAIVDEAGEFVVKSINSIAADYVIKPLEVEVLAIAVFRALEHHRVLRENQALYEYIELYASCKRMITQIEADQLRANILEAFVTEAGARAGIYALMLPRFKEPRLIEKMGIEDVESREILRLLTEEIKAKNFKRKSLRRLNLNGKLPPTSIFKKKGFTRAEVLLIKDEVENYGVLIALGHEYDNFKNLNFEDNSEFILRHALIGWNNVKMHQNARKLAYIDSLTGLYNSSFIEQELERLLAQKEKRPVTVLFLDLDRFKLVNDNYGHLNGSEVIIEAAKVIKGCVREEDIVARYGGDEYIVLLKNTDLRNGRIVAERIRKRIELQAFLGREQKIVKITTCVGVASYPEHSSNFLDLISLEDKAMYLGKNCGRNQVNTAANLKSAQI